jgi:hypothetical protein
MQVPLVWSRPSHSLQSLSVRQTYIVMACITALLVGLICADAVHRGLDRNFPNLYRNSASLGIAISELCHSTRGFVGLQDVATALENGGIVFVPNADQTRLEELTQHPDQARHVLESACELPNVDPSHKLVLEASETGMIDYYMLALSIFGYHIQAFFWLFAALLCLVAGCYIISFRTEPAFLLASAFWLLLLLLAAHQIDSSDLQIGTPANPRFLPMFSFYSITFLLALSASGQRLSVAAAVAAALSGLVFGFCANTRTYILWQLGPAILLFALAVIARHITGRFLPGRKFFAGTARWPFVIFGIAAIGIIAVHHARKDVHAYATSTFAGHEYWAMFLDSTFEDFAWQIPELEKRSGWKIGKNPDAYVGALLKIKIQERGERLEDYLDSPSFWNEEKREFLARQVMLDFWRDHPIEMLRIHFRVLGAIFQKVWFLLPKILVAMGIFAFGLWFDRLIVWGLCAAAIWFISDLFVTISFIALSFCSFVPQQSGRFLAALVPVGALAIATEMATTVAFPEIDTESHDYFYVTWFVGLLLMIQTFIWLQRRVQFLLPELNLWMKRGSRQQQ